MNQDNNGEVKTLKQLLDEKAINRTQLAKRMGVGRTTLSNWERGLGNITLENAVKLSRELRIPLRVLAAGFKYDVSSVPADIAEVTNYQESGSSIEHQQPDESQGAVSA
jgi:transcriptional regulator with XRE-family HTH domain